MKVSIALDPSIDEPEILIRAPQLTEEIAQLQKSILKQKGSIIFVVGKSPYGYYGTYFVVENILRLVVKKSPTGESIHYFFFMLKQWCLVKSQESMVLDVEY